MPTSAENAVISIPSKHVFSRSVTFLSALMPTVSSACSSPPMKRLHATVSTGHMYLIMFQTSYHDLRQNDHTSASHPGTAVHQNRQVCVLWVAGAVCVSPHGLDLLQVR